MRAATGFWRRVLKCHALRLGVPITGKIPIHAKSPVTVCNVDDVLIDIRISLEDFTPRVALGESVGRYDRATSLRKRMQTCRSGTPAMANSERVVGFRTVRLISDRRLR